MNKTKLNSIQLLFLITTFLTLQWTSTHIHFAKSHNHDGSIHKHETKTHDHQYLSNQNSSFELSHANIIEVDSKDYKQNAKTKKNPSFDIILQSSFTQTFKPFIKKEIPLFVNTVYKTSIYSNYNPRAPPLNS